jgi:hypothetical protein
MFVRAALPVAWSAATIVGLTSGATAQLAAPEVKIGERVVCSSLTEASKFASEVEKICLPRLNGIATREGDVLRIALRSGATKAFKDAPISCWEPKSQTACIYYTLTGHYPENDAIVVERWLGGPAHFRLGAYMMERATGRVIDLPNVPHHSPDGSRFISMSACADHCANRIDVWTVQDGLAKLEWRHRIKQQKEKTFAYEFVEWRGNEQIKLRILPEIEAQGDAGKDTNEAEAIDAKLTRAGQGWTLDSPLAR